MTQPRWLPRTFTHTLSEQFISDGPKLRRFCELFMRDANGNPIKLYEWQEWLIDHLLERYPEDHPDPDKAGRLRYRQVVISVARQNGKSVIASVLSMYGLLMHEEDPMVIGLASNAQQAFIIYDYTRNFIKGSELLAKKFKATGTRGITRLDKAGKYDVRPAKPDALQGIPVTLSLFDEVHICSPDMWQAMIKGTTAKKDGLVVGLTTAGDDNSALLLDLYKTGKKAAEGDPELERFGFFLWEAPEGASVDDPEALLDANPSAVCGGIPVSRLQDQVRTEPDHMARRYSLNQFVSSVASGWLPMSLFHKAGGAVLGDGPRFGSVDVAESMSYATIAVSSKVDEVVNVRIAQTFTKPSIETIVAACKRLRDKHNVRTFVMDIKNCKPIADALKAKGFNVITLGANDAQQAANITYGLFATDRIKHDNHYLLRTQLPKSARKPVGNSWAVSRAHSSVEIDTVMAFINAAYIAEKTKPKTFVFA